MRRLMTYLGLNPRKDPRVDTSGRVNRDGIRLYEYRDFPGMQAAGQLAAQILDEVAEHVSVGATTQAIDAFIERRVEEAGATSATSASTTR